MICKKCGKLFFNPVVGVEHGFCCKQCEETYNAVVNRVAVEKDKTTKKKKKKKEVYDEPVDVEDSE